MSIWKDIPRYSGAYQASSTGLIKSVDRTDSLGRKICGRLLKPYVYEKGHMKVQLYLNGVSVHEHVARLVLETFVGESREGQVARHIEGNPADNAVEHLAWGTYTENELDKRAHGTSRAHTRRIDVNRVLDLLRVGCLQQEVAAWLGLSQPYVSQINRGLYVGTT